MPKKTRLRKAKAPVFSPEWHARVRTALDDYPQRLAPEAALEDLLQSQSLFSVPVLGPARLPTDSAERKNIPLASGVLDYFPDALAAVAGISKAGNDQHNPGEPLHWARGKSMDQSDTLIRHFLERGSRDTDGLRHSAKMAWRALALLQLEIEQEKGLPPSRGSK